MALPGKEAEDARRRAAAALVRGLPGQKVPGLVAQQARDRQAAAADRANGIFPTPHGRLHPPRVYQDEDGKARQLKYGNDQALRGGDEGSNGYVPHPTPVYGKQGVAPPMPTGMASIGSRPNGASGPLTPSGQVNPFQPVAKPMPSALSGIGGTPSPRIPAAPVPSNGYDEPGNTPPNAMPNAMPTQAHFSVPPAPVTPRTNGPASALTPNNTKPLTVQPNWSFPPGRVPQQPDSVPQQPDSEPLQPTNAQPGLSPLQRFNLPKPLIPTLQTGDAVQQSMQAPQPLKSPPIPYDSNQPRLAIPTPPRKLLPPPTPQDVAAISRSQAEGRGADSLREKIAGIMMSPPSASEREDMFRRNNYGTSNDPVQRAKDFRLNESMANQHEHNVAGQKIIDRNQRVHDSRGETPTSYSYLNRFNNEYFDAMNGRPGGFGSQASRNAMTPEQRRYVDAPQAGVQSQPQSIFQRQAPPNNRMQGSVPVGPSRDMSGANGVAISQVDGSNGPQVGYIPANRSDGTKGTSRFVEGQETPLGTRVVRNPKTGGLALIGKGISGPSSGAADDPFAGNVPTQPTAAQFQAMQQQGSANETARIKARDTEEREADRLAGGRGRSKRQIADELSRDERVLSAARKNRLGMDIPAVARAAGREKIRVQDDLNKAAGMVANKSTIPGSLESKIKGGRNARGSDVGKWMESKAVDNDGYPVYSNEQDNLHSALEKEWGTMTPGEKRQAKDWYEQNEKYNKPQTWMGGGSWQGTPGDKKLKLLFKELDKGAAKPPASPPSQGATIPPTYGGTPPISPVKRGSSKL